MVVSHGMGVIKVSFRPSWNDIWVHDHMEYALKTQKYLLIHVAFQNVVAAPDEDLLFFKIQIVVPTIIQTRTRAPKTDSTIVATLTPDKLGLSSGSGSAWGVNSATCAMLDGPELKLLLSTLSMAMNM